jgi:transcriptional regulator with XRE-family HTH domain
VSIIQAKTSLFPSLLLEYCTHDKTDTVEVAVMDDVPVLLDESNTPRAVGRCLRKWRRDAGLSIRDVAERSGLSVSFISLVERGETEIAFTRLIRLADALGRHVSDVTTVVDAPKSSNGRKVEADEGAPVHTLPGGVEMAYMGEASWRMQPFIMTLQPGALHGPVAHSYEELVFCVEGQLDMVMDGEPVVVRQGGVLRVPENMMHGYRNTGDSAIRVLTIDLRSDMDTLLRTWAELRTT